MLFDHKDFLVQKFDDSIFKQYDWGTAIQTTLSRIFIIYSYSRSGFFVDLKNNHFFKIKSSNPDVMNSTIFHDQNDKYIYAIGGHSCKNEQPVASCAKLDINTFRWIKMPNLKIPRIAAQVLKIGDFLYAIQGFSQKTALDNIEVLDLKNENQGWQNLDQQIKFPMKKTSNTHRIQGIFQIPGKNQKCFVLTSNITNYDPKLPFSELTISL